MGGTEKKEVNWMKLKILSFIFLHRGLKEEEETSKFSQKSWEKEEFKLMKEK